MVVEFDVIPFEDLKGKWKKLGSGSFGNVYKATYLGIEVAIKEVLPSDEYDVSKYFDREWRLMREARHPNVVLYIALSRAPKPDNRIFIVAEYIENGNLRQYIYNKQKPLPWRLRLSFATDIVRAMAYLHARQCIHRDLKPENLLLTANGRVKVTDFGFARIVAQNAEETRRLTFCGTDSYMSPEILIGDTFGLETDVYSLGIILCELAARKLADDDTFKRVAPTYAIDVDEVRLLADPECPNAFLNLALACCATDRFARPSMRDVLAELAIIEAGVIARSVSKGDPHIGSIKFLGTKGKNPVVIAGSSAAAANGKQRPASRRIPSFGMGVHVGKVGNGDGEQVQLAPPGGTGPIRVKSHRDAGISSGSEDPSEDEEDAELEAILALNGVDIRDAKTPLTAPGTVNVTNGTAGPSVKSEMSWKLTGWMKEYAGRIVPQESQMTARPEAGPSSPDASTESLLARVPLLPNREKDSGMEVDPPEWSVNPNSSSVLTVRQTPTTQTAANEDHLAAATKAVATEAALLPEATRPGHHREPNANAAPSTTSIVMSDGETFFTAATSSTFISEPPLPAISPTARPATPPPTISSQATPIAPETPVTSIPAAPPSTPQFLPVIPRIHRFSLIKAGKHGVGKDLPTSIMSTWSPFELIFGSALGLGGAKCDLCTKRLGWKPCLECDDCGLTAHMKCGEAAPMDCEAREARKKSSPSRIPLRTASPKSNQSSPKSKSPKRVK